MDNENEFVDTDSDSMSCASEWVPHIRHVDSPTPPTSPEKRLVLYSRPSSPVKTVLTFPEDTGSVLAFPPPTTTDGLCLDFPYLSGLLEVTVEHFDTRDEVCMQAGGFKHGEIIAVPGVLETSVAIGVRHDCNGRPVLWFHQNGTAGAGTYTDGALKQAKLVGRQSVQQVTSVPQLTDMGCAVGEPCRACGLLQEALDEERAARQLAEARAHHAWAALEAGRQAWEQMAWQQQWGWTFGAGGMGWPPGEPAGPELHLEEALQSERAALQAEREARRTAERRLAEKQEEVQVAHQALAALRSGRRSAERSEHWRAWHGAGEGEPSGSKHALCLEDTLHRGGERALEWLERGRADLEKSLVRLRGLPVAAIQRIWRFLDGFSQSQIAAVASTSRDCSAAHADGANDGILAPSQQASAASRSKRKVTVSRWAAATGKGGDNEDKENKENAQPGMALRMALKGQTLQVAGSAMQIRQRQPLAALPAPPPPPPPQSRALQPLAVAHHGHSSQGGHGATMQQAAPQGMVAFRSDEELARKGLLRQPLLPLPADGTDPRSMLDLARSGLLQLPQRLVADQAQCGDQRSMMDLVQQGWLEGSIRRRDGQLCPFGYKGHRLRASVLVDCPGCWLHQGPCQAPERVPPPPPPPPAKPKPAKVWVPVERP